MAGKAKEEQSKYGREGTYTLSIGLENGYPHWLKTDGSQAIWFNKVTSWVVYDKSRLGDDVGGIFGPHGKDSYPNEIKQEWRYYDGTNWQDAGSNDIIFKATGTSFKPLLYKINSL